MAEAIKHSGLKFSDQDLGIGNMDGVAHSGRHYTPEALGILRRDLFPEDIVPEVTDPVAHQRQRRLTNGRAPEEQVPSDPATIDVGYEQELYNLLDATGGGQWDKLPEKYGIVTCSKPEDVGIVDWNGVKKRIKRNTKIGLALLAAGIPGFISSYPLALHAKADTAIEGDRAALDGLGLFGSIGGAAGGFILLYNTLGDAFVLKNEKEKSGKSRFTRRELRALTNPNPPQQRPEPFPTDLEYISRPDGLRPVGIFNVQTTHGNSAFVTVRSRT
jgi:hypothetical protein